ncbi:hypothetical protein [Clostridium sp. AWRP]|uniref:hypothetical protein n=1 Tax=Clostridium sp. AWRP TaxID=2212991 RepID=UPI001A9C1C3F|nr:hypothetical protein [Clostridium sp. AWRP]
MIFKDKVKQFMKNIEIRADKETVDYIQKELGYFIAYEDLFSTWLNKGNDFDR